MNQLLTSGRANEIADHFHQRARDFLEDGVDLGSIAKEKSARKKWFYTLASDSDRIQ